MPGRRNRTAPGSLTGETAPTSPDAQESGLGERRVIAVRTSSYASSESTTLAVADSHVEVETSTRTTRQVGHCHSAFA